MGAEPSTTITTEAL